MKQYIVFYTRTEFRMVTARSAQEAKEDTHKRLLGWNPAGNFRIEAAAELPESNA